MKGDSTFYRRLLVALVLLLALATTAYGEGHPLFPGTTDSNHENNPGIMEPVSTALEKREVRIPNTDQSADGVTQNLAENTFFENAFEGGVLSVTGNEITHVASPNADMRQRLEEILDAAEARDQEGMEAAATALKDILLGTTRGAIYDGFPMLNFNRYKGTDFGPIDPAFMSPDYAPGEYKMKVARDTGRTYLNYYNDPNGEERRIWEVDINMLYYDGQIDSDTFLLHFPKVKDPETGELVVDHHPDDVVHINYRIFSQVQEDFSPTNVILDRRKDASTVQFPFKGIDSVWIAFFPGEVLNVTVKYVPIRQFRGVYTWGWRIHPPRIQFLQPTYDIVNQHTGEVVRDPQSESFIYRNREDLTLDTIADAAPEMKMYKVVKAILLDGADAATIEEWLTNEDAGPAGTWNEWASLAENQRQLPPEVWDIVAAEDGLRPGELGDYQIISAYLNNEMYGFSATNADEIATWQQGDVFNVKLINLDKHTHYFRNVDFSARLNDDILRCCGGGETSFEVLNFKPSYGAPKVAEMQWRAGWGFRPHYDIIQQGQVFPRPQDRVRVAPYQGALVEGGSEGDQNNTFFGYQYSEAFRGGDFRFNPPPFIITDITHPAPFPLRDYNFEDDGLPGLVLGQRTEGYGVAQLCPQDAYPGFCSQDIAAYNPNGARNWPPPPLQGQGLCGERAEPCELRFPPFLRNPCQENSLDASAKECGDIIPPTGAWRPFLYLNPANGTIFIDPEDKSKGYWTDLTYEHGTPVFAGRSLNANIELPRAAGQVFYQFDDLFHDNSIFSPHPVFTAFDAPEEAETDEIFSVRAFFQNFVRVRGRISPGPFFGEMSEWVTLHLGGATEDGCTGPVLATSRVKARDALGDGSFVFRCGGDCLSPIREKGTAVPGQTICVMSTMGSWAEAVIEP